MKAKYSIIRLISFLCIFVCHVLQYYNNSLASWFNVGVIIFFALSGYLYGLKDINISLKWYFKQYKKIMIPYIIIFLIMLFLEYAFLGNSYSIFKIAKGIIGLQFTDTITTLTHTWFISYILICYLITPFLNRLFDKKKFTFKNITILLLLFFTIQGLNVINITNINIGYLFAYIFGYLLSKTSFKFKYIYILFALSLPIRIITQYHLINIPIFDKFAFFIILWNQIFMGLTIFKLLLKIKDIKYSKILKFSDKYSYYFYLIHQIFILNYFSLMKYGIIFSIIATILSGIALYYLTKYIKSFIEYLKNKNNYDKIISYLICIILILNPIFDLFFFNNNYAIVMFGVTLPTLIRLALLLFVIILYLIKYKDYKVLFVYPIILFIYLICQYFNCNFGNYNFIMEIKNVIILVYPLVLGYIIYKIKIDNVLLQKSLLLAGIIISLFIVAPTIFGFGLCAYSNHTIYGNFFDWFIPSDMGYMELSSKGLFYTSIISGSCLALIPYMYYCYIKNNKIIYLITSFTLTLSSIMLGTRASSFGGLLALIISFLLSIFFFIIKKIHVSKKSIIFSIIFILIIIYIFCNAPIISRIQTDKYKSKENLDVTSSKLMDDNKILDCNKYSNATLIKKIDDLKTIYINEKFIYKIYSYKQDPIFWCDIINNYSIIDQQNNRFIEEKILQRVILLNNKSLDKYFGYGYSKTSSIYNLEKDFKYQYYSMGIIGLIITVLIYPIIFIIDGCLMLFKKEITFYNCILMLSMGICIFFAYYSGNTLNNLGVVIYMGVILGMLTKNILNKKSLSKSLNEKKITILALHLGTGGVEKYISSLCKMLQDNYELEIICTYKLNSKPAFAFNENIKINYLINDKPYKNEFKQALKDKKIHDIINYGLKNIKILILKYARNVKAIKNINSKYIITTRIFHNKIVNELLDDNYIKIATEHNYPKNKKYINKIVDSTSNFNYLIVVSNDLQTIYKNKLLKPKCVYIPNVIDELPKTTKKSNNTNTLISVGRLSKEKGYEDLLDILVLIKNKISNIKLYLIGDGGEKNNLILKTKELNLTDNIEFLGFLDTVKCNYYMSKSNVYVMTSYTESFGLVLIEAMSNKLPCIAFDSANGAKNLLSNNVGILIKNRNKEDMAEEIIKLLKNSDTQKIYSEKGYNYCQKYLLSNVKKDWLGLLEENN